MEVGSPAFSYIRYFGSACVHVRGKYEMFFFRGSFGFWGGSGESQPVRNGYDWCSASKFKWAGVCGYLRKYTPI